MNNQQNQQNQPKKTKQNKNDWKCEKCVGLNHGSRERASSFCHFCGCRRPEDRQECNPISSRVFVTGGGSSEPVSKPKEPECLPVSSTTFECGGWSPQPVSKPKGPPHSSPLCGQGFDGPARGQVSARGRVSNGSARDDEDLSGLLRDIHEVVSGEQDLLEFCHHVGQSFGGSAHHVDQSFQSPAHHGGQSFQSPGPNGGQSFYCPDQAPPSAPELWDVEEDEKDWFGPRN